MADIVKSNVVRIDLAKTGLVRNYQPVIIGEGDALANAFGVEVVRDGQPVDLTSVNVTAYFIRPNRSTVVINGGLVEEGNIASVTLPQACYAYDGVFSLAIKLTGDSVTGTVRIVDGAVVNTVDGPTIDPGSVVPTLDELLAKIDEMEVATAAAIEATEATEAAIGRTEHLLETSEQTAWNQLNANSGATSTASGVTFTNNGDGTWTLTGNGTATERKQISAVSLTAGHVYAVLNGGIDTTGLGTYLCLTRNGSSVVSFYKEQLFTADIGYNQFSIRTTSSFAAPEGGLTFAPMLIDLTDIYGAGLEPTLAEFRQQYPHRIYPYAAIGSVRNLDITEVHGAQIAELQDDLDDANDAITANATAITALDNAKANKSDLAHTNRVVSALVEAGKGKILRFETDDDDAYAKSVPSGALNATVTEIGGKSVVWNNKVQNGNFAATTGWSTTNASISVANNEVTVTATSTTSAFGIRQSLPIETHKYYIAVDINTPASVGQVILELRDGTQVRTVATSSVTDAYARVAGIYTVTSANESGYVRVISASSSVSTDPIKAKKFVMVDLTQMGFADITSVDGPRIRAIEAYAMAHPEYNAGEIVNADVNSINVVGKNGAVGFASASQYTHTDGFYYGGVSAQYLNRGTFYSFDADRQYTFTATIKCETVGNVRLAFYYSDGTHDESSRIADTELHTLTLTSDKNKTITDAYIDYSTSVNVWIRDDISLVHTDANISHPIPSAVLAAYPLRSAGNVYDTISWDGEKWWHSKAVGTVDLGTLTWAYSSNTGHEYMRADFAGAKKPTAIRDVANILTSRYTTVSANDIYDHAHEGIGLHNEYDQAWVYATDMGTDPTAFKTAMDGVELLYELTTPIRTDITDLMGTAGTDLIAMAVESGGTITFAQNGDTIFPVPNSVTYTVKISEVE